MVVLVFKSSLTGLCLLVRLFFPFIFNVISIVIDPHPPSLYLVLLTSFIVCYLFLFSWNLSQAKFRWDQSCSGWYGQKPFQKTTNIPFYCRVLLHYCLIILSLIHLVIAWEITACALHPPNLLCSGVFYCFLSRLCLPAVVTHLLSALHPIVRLLLQIMLEMWHHCIRCTWSLLPHRYPVVSVSGTLLSFLDLHTSTWIHFPLIWRLSMEHLWCVRNSFHLYLPRSVSVLLFTTISVHI